MRRCPRGFTRSQASGKGRWHHVPMRFSVSIPAADAASPRLRETLASIFAQTALHSSETQAEIFIVTPNPQDLPEDCVGGPLSKRIDVHLLKDPGIGLYAALSQSFSHHTGQVHSYLGVGDTFEPQAFAVVTEVLSSPGNDEGTWITGMIASRRADGAIVRVTLPPSYSQRGIRRGIYGRLAPSLQQESTWWTDGLHKSIPLEQLAEFRLAGDYFIWRHFSTLVKPVVVESVLGSFRWHHDNMSADWPSYLAEMDAMCPRLTLTDRALSKWYQFAWALPNRWKARQGERSVLRWGWPEGPWN